MATKLADLDVAATTGAWTASGLSIDAGSKTVTLRRKSDGAVLATRSFTVGSSAVAVSDNFNRANGALGTNWSTPTGANAMEVNSNQVRGSTAAAFNVSYWSADTFAGNHYAVMPSAPGTAKPAIRVQAGAKTYYYADNYDDGEGTAGVAIHKVVNGTDTEIAFGDPAYSGTVRLEAVGTTIRARDGALASSPIVATVTDSSISGGSPGVTAWGSEAGDNWSGGDL